MAIDERALSAIIKELQDTVVKQANSLAAIAGILSQIPGVEQADVEAAVQAARLLEGSGRHDMSRTRTVVNEIISAARTTKNPL